MNNVMEYKGYVGSMEFSEKDKVFYGKVLGIRSLISYEGTTTDELVAAFHASVDDYLESCREEGTAPLKTKKEPIESLVEMGSENITALFKHRVSQSQASPQLPSVSYLNHDSDTLITKKP